MEKIRKLPMRINKSGRLHSWAVFECPKCLQEVERRLDNGLRQKSCGCDKVKHGESKTKLHDVWRSMKKRILNPKTHNYKDYGGRGIKICDEWLEYIPFRDWALNNGYEEGLVIDRRNPDGNYESSNCRFLTVLESLRNKTNTITMEIANEIRALCKTGKYLQRELAEKFGVCRQTISSIINNRTWRNT